MNTDREYLRILNKYNINENLSLYEVHRKILVELKKNHPDNNRGTNSEQVFKEINNDNLFIKKLIRQYGEKYVYRVNKDNKNEQHKTNVNYNGHENNNNQNNHTQDNDDEYDELKMKVDVFKIKIQNIKAKYYYINQIVIMTDKLLNNEIKNIKSKKELKHLEKIFDFNVEYYIFMYFLIINKDKYENEEIDKLTNNILEMLSKAKSINDIISIKKIYYNQFEPIKMKIEKIIQTKVKPIEEVLNSLKNNSNINISTFEIYNLLNGLKDIYSIKKIDIAINKTYSEIKKIIIGKLQQLLQNDALGECYDYITKTIVDFDSAENILELYKIAESYNSYMITFIKNQSMKIINNLTIFRKERHLDSYEQNKINDYINNLEKNDKINVFLELDKKIKEFRLEIIKKEFRNRIYNDKLLEKEKNKYLHDLHNIKTEEQLLKVIKEYDDKVNFEEERVNKINNVVNQTKKELVDILSSLKEKYKGTDFIHQLDHLLWRLEYANKQEELEKIVENFQIELLYFEKDQFIKDINGDIYNEELYNLRIDTLNKIYKINSISELKQLKDYYYEEKDKLLNLEESKNIK